MQDSLLNLPMLARLFMRQFYNTSSAPTITFSGRKNVAPNTSQFRNLFKIIFLIFVKHINCILFVIHLSYQISPFDITFFIMSIIIFSIQSMFRSWFSSDFFQKLLKRIKAKLNPSLTIIRITFRFWISATSFSRTIGRIFRRLFLMISFVSRFIMFGKSFCRTFIFPATTRFCFSTFEGLSNSFGVITTITNTKPHSFLMHIWRELLNYQQSIKTLSNQKSFFHIDNYNTIGGTFK